MRGDNVVAVTGVNLWGGAKDKKVCLFTRMLGRLEIMSGGSHGAKHVPGAQNTLTDGISRRPWTQFAARVREPTNSQNLVKQSTRKRGEMIFQILIQTTIPLLHDTTPSCGISCRRAPHR